VTAQESVTYPPLPEAVKQYQDPAQVDKITKIRKDLDETTEILVSVRTRRLGRRGMARC
jgi:synaptobrevin family protein YKT6